MRPLIPSNERGETMLSLLAALLLGSIILASAVANFSDAWRRASDTRMMEQAESEARTLLDIMAYDLRMTGSGMPLGQSGFAMTNAALGTAPLPVLTSSTATSIVFRLNELGTNTVLTSAYTPSSSTLSFSVLSSTGFSVGDTIYLSNMPSAGSAGLQGTITSKTATQISIANTYVASTSPSFPTGSIAERVATITLSSGGSAGITRNSGSGAVLLSPRSSFTATYLDGSGNPMTLPLTATTIQDSLSAIKLVVSVTSSRRLLDGEFYTATAQHTVALRNLNIIR